MTSPALLITGLEYGPHLPVDGRELRQIMACLLDAGSALRPMPAVELVLVRDKDMALCNSVHMGLPGPTNILSFPAEPVEPAEHTDPGLPVMPAGLVLSVDTLLREAFLYKEDPRKHLLRLLAHGLGHAAGFDHGSEMDIFCTNILSSQEKIFQQHRKTA